jgi:hypothetical protein
MSVNPLHDWSRFDAGGHPDYLAESSLDIHVTWCIWHEGVPYYRDSLAIDAFRRMCVSKQDHNGSAASMINAASNDELRAVLDTMYAYFHQTENGGYKMAHKHLSWVLDHEGRRSEVLGLLDNREFAKIRAIYESEQEHNPHVHHLVQAIDDSTLQKLIDTMRT